MDKIEVKTKYFQGTIITSENGTSHHMTVQDNYMKQDYDATIAKLKTSDESEEIKAEKLFKHAFRQTLVEMKKIECDFLIKNKEKKSYVEEEVVKIYAKDVTERYISKDTLISRFFDIGYDCLKEYGKKNGEEQITIYAEQIHEFISILLQRKPCKELNNEISLAIIEEIISPIAMGKLKSKNFPYFLLFYVMIVLLPEKYIFSMFTTETKKEKERCLAEVCNEMCHLYDHEYMAEEYYLLDDVKRLRTNIFDVYCTVIDWYWKSVKTMLDTLKIQMVNQEWRYQRFDNVKFKKADMELDGYLYLYESFMDSEDYWINNNFVHMLEILKNNVEYLENAAEEKVSSEIILSENASGKNKKRNRTKIDKHLMESYIRLMESLQMDEEDMYLTKRSKYIKKSIYFVLDTVTENWITGKKFPSIEKKIFLNEQQKKEYTYAMKYVDCMLIYLLKCYREALVPDLFSGYCDLMIERYLDTETQSMGCDEIETYTSGLITFYRVYEQELYSKAYSIIKALLFDDDIADMLSAYVIRNVWQSLFFKCNVDILLKKAYPEIEIGTLPSEKDFFALDKKHKKEMQSSKNVE